MTFEEAKEKAAQYLKDNYGLSISRISETKDYWIFSSSLDNDSGLNRIKFHVDPVCISKTNGNLEECKLPSDLGFNIIENSQVIYDKERN